MNKKIAIKAFGLGCLFGLVSMLVTGCGAVPIKEILPDTVWIEATGAGEVRIGVDEYPPVSLEHEGDVTIVWDFSWPPKLVEVGAGECARVAWMFLEHESEGCDFE